MFVSNGELENTKIFDGVKVISYIWAIIGLNALNRYNGVMFNRD